MKLGGGAEAEGEGEEVGEEDDEADGGGNRGGDEDGGGGEVFGVADGGVNVGSDGIAEAFDGGVEGFGDPDEADRDEEGDP